MVLLNYLYLIMLGGVELVMLYSQRRNITLSFRRRWMPSTGSEHFWVILFSTSLFAFTAEGTIDLQAVRLMVLEMLCILAIMSRSVGRWPLALLLYLAFMVWVALGCVYSQAPLYGLRAMVKYCYPLLIALTGMAVAGSFHVFLVAGMWARRLALVSFVVSWLPFRDIYLPGVFWYETAAAINYISLAAFSAALYFYHGRRLTDLLWTIFLSLPPFIWVFRTSILGLAVAVIFFSFLRWRLKALLPMIAGMIIGVACIFAIPSLREKTFHSSTVTLTTLTEGRMKKDDINSNARFGVWQALEQQFYAPHILAGSGSGTIQHYLYSNFVFGGIRQPHNDFVLLRCDNGLIGLALYLAAITMVVVSSWRLYRRSANWALRLMSIVVVSSMVGVVSTQVAENVFTYSMTTLAMPFGFYGMLQGVVNRRIRFSSQDVARRLEGRPVC
ncbi:MAG: O-antigen ligase family protein [Bacteroidales bacterium]|nr:O-antigen ligase family protein [Bacteroidales bacterium]